MPYLKAIFSYSLGWALLSNSHTSISGSSFSGFFLLVKKNGYLQIVPEKQKINFYKENISYYVLDNANNV